MRQAVVVIHGIGEQEPMSTIRSFAETLLATEDGKPAEYYSKPDGLSDLFELRRLQSRGRNQTDFYEYYWAYNVESTKITDVTHWIWRLLWRKRRNIPLGLRPMWYLSWALIVAFGALVVSGVLGSAHGWVTNQKEYTLAGAGLFLIWSTVQYAFISYIGDAARYLSPRPANIKCRQKIRSDGVKLLRCLHDSKKYDRIIIVGHSLGSVIGYDLITHLWQSFHDDSSELQSNATIKSYIRAQMANSAPVQPIIRDQLSPLGEALSSVGGNATAIADFQRMQMKAWREQRSLGNRWRISDFVTLGSPLAHAMLLFSAGEHDFEKRKSQRELVTCPPQLDDKGYAYGGPTVDVREDPSPANPTPRKRGFTPLLLHHGAPFAVTRWTNIYFPVRFGFFGDLVGGELRSVLGAGIRDVPVCTARWRGLANWSPVAHTSYWFNGGLAKAGNRSAIDAVQALKQIINLRELRKFRVSLPIQPKPLSGSSTLERAPVADHGEADGSPAPDPVPPA